MNQMRRFLRRFPSFPSPLLTSHTLEKHNSALQSTANSPNTRHTFLLPLPQLPSTLPAVKMEDMAAMFSGLPGFSPLMSLNPSETNAARRLLQLPCVLSSLFPSCLPLNPVFMQHDGYRTERRPRQVRQARLADD